MVVPNISKFAWFCFCFLFFVFLTKEVYFYISLILKKTPTLSDPVKLSPLLHIFSRCERPFKIWKLVQTFTTPCRVHSTSLHFWWYKLLRNIQTYIVSQTLSNIKQQYCVGPIYICTAKGFLLFALRFLFTFFVFFFFVLASFSFFSSFFCFISVLLLLLSSICLSEAG